jgi:hypothetical protein
LGGLIARRKEIKMMHCEDLMDLLLLVDVDVSQGTILSWTDKQRKEVEKWAGKYYLKANDNPTVRVPPRPTFLPQDAAQHQIKTDVCHTCGHPWSEHSHNRVGHEMCP